MYGWGWSGYGTGYGTDEWDADRGEQGGGPEARHGTGNGHVAAHEAGDKAGHEVYDHIIFVQTDKGVTNPALQKVFLYKIKGILSFYWTSKYTRGR